MLKLYRKEFKGGQMKVADRKPILDKKGKETGEKEVYYHYFKPQDMSRPEKKGTKKDDSGKLKSLPAKVNPLKFTDEKYAMEHCEWLSKC